jgi:hypothetical protein
VQSDIPVIGRIVDHIDNKTADMGDEAWFEPIENDSCIKRFEMERQR